jgi:hypothetical protein
VVEKPGDVDTICGRGSTASLPPPTCTTLYVTVPEKKHFMIRPSDKSIKYGAQFIIERQNISSKMLRTGARISQLVYRPDYGLDNRGIGV